jgi:hypothetical protein
MVPTSMRALSALSALWRIFRTSFRRDELRMSMKSMTISPPRSRSRSCRAASSAASQLAMKAVSSMSLPFIVLPEFTSTDTRASVCSMTSEPPAGSGTVFS